LFDKQRARIDKIANDLQNGETRRQFRAAKGEEHAALAQSRNVSKAQIRAADEKRMKIQQEIEKRAFRG
jgi:predicted  nucleic acid-binding Zn-ribbon protein